MDKTSTLATCLDGHRAKDCMMLDLPDDLAVLVLAVALDLAMGEVPNRLHPTAWIGATISLAEKAAPKVGVQAAVGGAVLALVVVGVWTAAAYFAALGLHSVHDLAYVLVGAFMLKTTFAIRMLHQAAARVASLLTNGDVAGARNSLRSLVSRDTTTLNQEQATGAAVESVSENMTDSFVGPWLFFALFGLPGAVAYRAINTLDSMLGYHGYYEHLGKASARLDDLANLVPARLSALLLVVGSFFLPGQNAPAALRIMWRDHRRTESPNAGWTMSGMAGALGVKLEKTSPEGGYQLGDCTRPLEVKDIARAVQSMYFVGFMALIVALAISYLRHGAF